MSKIIRIKHEAVITVLSKKILVNSENSNTKISMRVNDEHQQLFDSFNKARAESTKHTQRIEKG